MGIYSKKILEHFLHPKYMGKISNPDGIGDTTNLKCGDTMRIYIKVEKNIIKDIKFETLGCGPAIASSDMICELAKGKTITQAKKIKFNDVAKQLGKVPDQKIHCIGLAEYALQKAIEDFESKSMRS